MKKLSPLLLIPVAALLGAGGGMALRLSGAGASSEGHAGDADESGGPQSETNRAPSPKKENPKSVTEGHGSAKEHSKSGSGHEKTAEPSTYMKFSRQFVAPIVKTGRPMAMMILDVNLELDSSAADSVYAEEPKLRDAVLKVLLKQASEGKLEAMFHQPEMLEETRSKILEATRAIIGDSVNSVLIMDVGYQEL